MLRSQQLDVAASAAAHQRAKDAHQLSLERTAEFRRLCSDTLWLGLTVMAAAALYKVMQRGLLHGVGARCGVLGGSSRSWGPWAAWRVAQMAGCYVLAIGDVMAGLAVLLAAPWLLYRTGFLSDYHTLPFTKLLVGLGLVCGAAGGMAVGKLGGSSMVWLAIWEGWVVMHVAFSAAAHGLNRIALQQAGSSGTPASIYEQPRGVWLPAAMWVVLGLAAPLAAGVLPF